MAEIAVVNSTELPVGSSTSSDDAKKKFRAVRQGARPSRFQRLFFWLIWLCITVEFYFADSNLPYDKCVDSFILVRLKHNQFSQVHVGTTLENPGTLGSH